MRNRVWFAGAAWLLLLSAICLPAAAQAPIQVVAPSSASEVEDLLRQGKELEAERRWADAVVLYEEAIRNHPDQQELQQRAGLAKVHYDLARRYADTSFKSSVTTLREQEALRLYDEVLQKIDAHYVQSPAWQHMLQRGAVALEVALQTPDFLTLNLPTMTTDRIGRFILEMRAAVAGRQVRTRTEARDAALMVARMAQQRLGLPSTAALLEFACGATGALDEYSTYLTGEQLTDLYSQIEGNFVGLGIELKADQGALLIVNVITGSPAERSGIKPGDRITAVAGRATNDMNTDEAANMLQGAEGSVAQLVVVSPGQAPRGVAVRREHVEVPSVDHVQIIDAQSGIAYLKLTCFQKTTARDLDAALWKLHGQGMRSLIMDLRGNPGGLLTSSVEIADKFIEQGTIVSTRGRSTGEDFNYSAQRVGTWRVPLVVLIDGDSASASEIFAGAIRDHRRGQVVGVRSYGKGSVQGIFPLGTAGAGIRLTTAKFYSPNGQAYAKVGVQPDIVVQKVAKPIDGQVAAATSLADDPMISAALQAARQNVAKR